MVQLRLMIQSTSPSTYVRVWVLDQLPQSGISIFPKASSCRVVGLTRVTGSSCHTIESTHTVMATVTARYGVGCITKFAKVWRKLG